MSALCERDKVVLITGAAGGLGRAMVQCFLTANWRVIAASRRPADWPPADRLTPSVMDVTNTDQVDKTFSEVILRHGRIDCLIHNAGITNDALSWQIKDDAWDNVLKVNLKGAFLCAQAAVRHMEESHDGHIILISSFAGRSGAAGQANYAAAKAGLFGLAQSLAREFGSQNVRVNAILPGVLPTKMTEKLAPDRLNRFAQDNVLGRINSLDEVARFVTFLAATQNISGQIFHLDSRIARWG